MATSLKSAYNSVSRFSLPHPPPSPCCSRFVVNQLIPGYEVSRKADGVETKFQDGRKSEQLMFRPLDS